MHRIIHGAVIVVGIACAVQRANGQNIVKNPGVEAGTESPDDWKQGLEVQGVAYSWDRTLGFKSEASLCLNKTVQESTLIAQWFQTVDRTGDRPRLRVGARVKAENVTEASLDVQFLDARGEWISHQEVAYIGSRKDGAPPANHGWKKYSGRVDIPQNTKTMRIGLQISGRGKVWFDDITATYAK